MNRQQNNKMTYPLLGTLNQQQLKDIILDSMINEASSAEFLSRLLGETGDTLQREFIQSARDTKLAHLQILEKLYLHFFGTKPLYEIRRIEYPNYKEALLIALKDELEYAERYRDVQLSTKDPLVRDTFYQVMVDELTLATRFGFLYNMV